MLRDIHSSVIVLDNKGMIHYINKPAARKFGIDEGIELGKVHFEANLENSYNDDFNQYIFDCIYQKKETHSGVVQSNLERMIVGDHKKGIAIVLWGYNKPLFYFINLAKFLKKLYNLINKKNY